MSEEVALKLLRREVEAQRERRRVLRRRRGYERDGDEEACVEDLGAADLLASLSHEQRLGLAKAEAAVAWIASRLEGADGGKVVVFAHHLVVLNALHHMLNVRFGCRPPVHRLFQGAVDEHTRATYLREFKQGRCRVMLMSLQAGAVGVDLTAAAEALFVQLPADVAQLKQAEARIHRKGQRRACQAHFLVSGAPEDGETLAWERLRAQGNSVQALHDGTRDAEDRDALPVHRTETFSAAASSSSSLAAGPALRPAPSHHGSASKAPTPLDRPETALGPRMESALAALVAAARRDQDAPLRPVPDEPFLEVRLLTGRVHLHASADGAEPCGVSFTPEALLAAHTAAKAASGASAQEGAESGGEGGDEGDFSAGPDSSGLLPCGLTLAEASAALDLPPALMLRAVALARSLSFARALRRLGAADRNFLGRWSATQPVPAAVVAAAPAAAALKAWVGERRREDRERTLVLMPTATPDLSTERHTTTSALLAANMAAGFTLKEVRVATRGGVRAEQQPWGASADGTGLHPLCFRCKVGLPSPSHSARWATSRVGMKDGVSALAIPCQQPLLPKRTLTGSPCPCCCQVKFRTLFCNGACFKVLAQQTSAGGFRRAAGLQDGGVCQSCGLDCFRLVSELGALLDLAQVREDTSHILFSKGPTVALISSLLRTGASWWSPLGTRCGGRSSPPSTAPSSIALWRRGGEAAAAAATRPTAAASRTEPPQGARRPSLAGCGKQTTSPRCATIGVGKKRCESFELSACPNVVLGARCGTAAAWPRRATRRSCAAFATRTRRVARAGGGQRTASKKGKPAGRQGPLV
jgi:hypothetical protein